MSDFHEKITMHGDISFNPNQSPNPKNPFGCKVAQQEYIRADLVPQWQPIETVPINTPVLAVVRNEPEYGRVAIVGSSFPDKLKLHYSHWMPIPKVPG